MFADEEYPARGNTCLRFMPEGDSISISGSARAIEAEFPHAEKPIEELTQLSIKAPQIAYGEKNGSLFIFARKLKGALPFDRRDIGYETLWPYALLFAEVMNEWHQTAVWAFHINEAAFCWEHDMLEILFEKAWISVEFGLDENDESEDLLSVALRYAAQLPEDYFKGISNPFKRQILGIAEYLHRRQDGRFLLPQEKLAGVLGYPVSSIQAILKVLRKNGYLEVTKSAIHLQGQAHEYRFHSPNKS